VSGTYVDRPLSIFLCYAKEDIVAVRELYERLRGDGVNAWLDEEELLPGQYWRDVIPDVVHDSDAVIVCLSSRSVSKEGYVQKEIRVALDAADEKPEDTIYIIPARFEKCAVPRRLSNVQWVDLFNKNGYQRLISALRVRAEGLGKNIPLPKSNNVPRVVEAPIIPPKQAAPFIPEERIEKKETFQPSSEKVKPAKPKIEELPKSSILKYKSSIVKSSVIAFFLLFGVEAFWAFPYSVSVLGILALVYAIATIFDKQSSIARSCMIAFFLLFGVFSFWLFQYSYLITGILALVYAIATLFDKQSSIARSCMIAFFLLFGIFSFWTFQYGYWITGILALAYAVLTLFGI
jgi:uncharacterized membrane protein